MGAGVTSAESVTGDIIFPNYKWPELEEVKKLWNVTTFVLVDQKMVKQMSSGQYQFSFPKLTSLRPFGVFSHLDHLTPEVKPWVVHSFLTFDSMDRTLECDHSLESC